jgi:hypothetical protein
MIRRCTDADIAVIESIINEAAARYRGAIPEDCWHEPYMPRDELESEIASGVNFWGWEERGELIGVMGVQQVLDATLIRLLESLKRQVTGPLLIGTWAAAEWAIRFYQGHGFRLVSTAEKNRLLGTYWTIPDRQRDTSVVLTRDWPPISTD